MRKQMIFRKIILSAILPIFLVACGKNEKTYDASGSFEAVETIISSEVGGRLIQFTLEEGQELKAGEVLGYIDSTDLTLRKQQIIAQTSAVLSRKPDIAKQVAALEEQIAYLEREKGRIQRLVSAEAATKKQLDDINNQIEINKKQLNATLSSLEINTNTISKETAPLQMQVKQLNNQLSKYSIINPMNGTVLVKYSETNEIIAPGRPLYKIADLTNMQLKAYVSANQLGQIKIGQTVSVRIDNGKDNYKEYEGLIERIASKAEFTPKTIQTKEERQNLVYAIKIKVKNDGFLKIGMYGEAIFK